MSSSLKRKPSRERKEEDTPTAGDVFDYPSKGSEGGAGDDIEAGDELETVPAPKKRRLKRAAMKRGKKHGEKKALRNSKYLHPYKFICKIKEDHGKPIYSVKFNFCDLRHRNMVATVGSNMASVYRMLENGQIEHVLEFRDENPEESWFTCCWSINEKTGAPLLILAGQTGVIQVLNCHTLRVEMQLRGHGMAINELCLHPLDNTLLASASRDTSIRLWNLKTGTNVITFAGDGGHRDEVLSVDINLAGDMLVSSGMDHAIKVWRLDSPDILQAIQKSHDAPCPMPKSKEDWQEWKPRNWTKIIQQPDFSTTNIHHNYVDSVKWYGKMLMSKSTNEVIVLWQPQWIGKKKSIVIVDTFHYYDCDIWYIKFALDFRQNLLSVGNKSGCLFVWDVSRHPSPGPLRLQHPSNVRAVRQVALSYDGSIVLGVNEDGTLVRWDWAHLHGASK